MKTLIPGQPDALSSEIKSMPLAAAGPSGALCSAILSSAIGEHMQAFAALEEHAPVLAAIAARMVETLRMGGKILFCGNGGSAADAQHLAAELVGRFRQPRRGLAALALTTDSSVMTSIANDFGYSEVFRRQVEALGAPGDMLIGLSTSGESENVCAAMAEARRMGLYGVALVGGKGGRLAEFAEMALSIASGSTARVQEAHLFCGHVLCELVECAMIEAHWMTRVMEEQQAGLPFEFPAAGSLVAALPVAELSVEAPVAAGNASLPPLHARRERH